MYFYTVLTSTEAVGGLMLCSAALRADITDARESSPRSFSPVSWPMQTYCTVVKELIDCMCNLVLLNIITAMFVYSLVNQRAATWQIQRAPTVMKRMRDILAHPHTLVSWGMNKSCESVLFSRGWRYEASKTFFHSFKYTHKRQLLKEFKEDYIKMPQIPRLKRENIQSISKKNHPTFIDICFVVGGGGVGGGVGVVSPKWGKIKTGLPAPPPYMAFSWEQWEGGRSRTVQDILTGYDGWTAAAAEQCGGKSQLSGASRFSWRCCCRSVSGCVRMWNRHGQEALWRLVIR